jgi:transposase
MKEQNQISMDIVNPKAAGIDIGSRSHFVAIGQKEEHTRDYFCSFIN